MRQSILFGLLVGLCSLCALTLACDDREDPDKSWGNDTYGPGGEATESAIRYDGYTGDWGDITVAFILRPADNLERTVSVEYRGACAGDEWTPALTSGSLLAIKPGRHEFIWHSHETEAGCAGEVNLRLMTDKGEADVSEAIPLDNAQDGRTGFAEFPQFDQGVNPSEMYAFDRSLDALLADDSVDFVATRIDDVYEVHAARGYVAFQRVPTARGYEYEIVDLDGDNPIGRQDPTWGATYEEEIALGSNPNNSNWPEEGYEPGEERLSFIEPEDDSYAFGYERIAAYFDSPDAADFMINWKGYAHSVNYVGNHGSLNIIQSRSPMLMWGAGVKPGRIEEFVRHVDIAPTVGALLGMEKTEGVDERGVFSRNVYLKFQDGHVIESAISDEGTAHVILIIMDGLTHTEIEHEVRVRPEQLPNFARFFNEGAWAGYGSIANWPSVTYPGHNMVGSGMYSGHHGIIDNEYYIRPRQEYADPINSLILSEDLFNPAFEGETLHGAVHRNFGKYKPEKGKGALTAALVEPSTFGADKADLEFRDKTGEVPFPPLGLYWPPEIPGPNPSLRHASTMAMQFVEQIAMIELWHLLFEDTIPQPTYTIMNFITTDDSGHSNGPHGDQMKKVLDHLDRNLGLIFDWLETSGMDRDTTVIVTSDHGMQIGDPSRGGWPPDSLDAAGIVRAADTYLGVYLKVPAVYVTPGFAPEGAETTFAITVQDDDLGFGLENAIVQVRDDDEVEEVLTDGEGRAYVTLTPTDDLTVTVSRPDYTETRTTISLN